MTEEPETQTDESIDYVHVPEKRRYEVRDGETVAGFTQYRRSEEHTDFVHTEVDEAYNGRGLASRLVEFALSDVRASGKRIIPHCPYVARWLTRHHEFDDIVDWPTQAS